MGRRRLYIIFVVMCMVLCFKVAAQAQQAAPVAVSAPSTTTFFSTFGLGIGVTMNLGKERTVEEAQLINGVVRVTKERQVVPRLLLEKHWYFNSTTDFGSYGKPGMFLAVNLGDEHFIEAFGAGLLWSFKGSSSTTNTNNVGVGLAVEPYSRVLGDGIKANEPLPAGESQIRYKETNRTAIIFFYTYTM